MLSPVLEDVHDGMANLARRRQRPRMISIAPDRASPTEAAIDGPGGTNGQPLDAKPKSRGAVAFDEQVDMVHLHAELYNPKPVLRRDSECCVDRGEDVLAPK
jgi:hypothetical protein